MYNIEYLVQETGISRRTIRYYVQRGLLPPPEGNRRGSYYTPDHLERLQLIHQLVQRGTPLIQIKEVLEKGEAPAVADDKIVRRRIEHIEMPHGIELTVPQHLLSDCQVRAIRNYIIEVIRGEENDG